MEFIRWCGIFVIGQPVIDSQHQELFRIINNFHNELAKGVSNKLPIEILNGLIKFAQKHFADEEKISRQFGFPEENHTSHQNIHEQLIIDIFQLHDDISEGIVTKLDDINDFLTDWIILHILIEDYKYKPYLKNNKNTK